MVSAGLWAAGLSWMFPMMASMTILNKYFLGADRTDWLMRLYCSGQVRLTGSRWRAVVHPDVHPTTSYAFFQNHVSILDHVTLYCATPHFKQGIELEEHFKIPLYGPWTQSRGTIPVKKGAASLRELRERVRAETRRGHSIIGFPEGTRTRTGLPGRFRAGLFYIARDLGLPIVPVSVTGMFEVLPKGSWLIRPGQDVTVHCLAPVLTVGLRNEEIPGLVRQVQASIAAPIQAYYQERNQEGAGIAPQQRRS